MGPRDPGGARTHSLGMAPIENTFSIRSPTRYPISPQGLCAHRESNPTLHLGRVMYYHYTMCTAPGVDRTPGLLLTKQTLYH